MTTRLCFRAEADNGKPQVRGCTFRFRDSGPHIVLKQGLKHAIISENNNVKGVHIVNDPGGQAMIVNNGGYRPHAG